MAVAQILGGISAAGGVAASVYAFFNPTKRVMGPFGASSAVNGFNPLVAPCTVSERTNDTAVITDHPVDNGSPISDHMYNLPIKLDIEIVYSLSSGINGLKAIGAALGVTNANTMTLAQYYSVFQVLQTTQQLLNITTPKRQYKNMALEAIDCVTDVNSENILKLQLRFREVIIVSTDVTAIPNADQANAPATASPSQQNNTQPNPPSSTLGSNFSNSVVSDFNPTIPTPVP